MFQAFLGSATSQNLKIFEKNEINMKPWIFSLIFHLFHTPSFMSCQFSTKSPGDPIFQLNSRDAIQFEKLSLVDRFLKNGGRKKMIYFMGLGRGY